MRLTHLAGRLAVKIEAMRRARQGDQVAGVARVAPQELRQRLLAEHARHALLDIRLDMQLQRLEAITEQRGKVLAQLLAAVGGARLCGVGGEF